MDSTPYRFPPPPPIPPTPRGPGGAPPPTGYPSVPPPATDVWGLRAAAFLIDSFLANLLFYAILLGFMGGVFAVEAVVNADQRHGDPSPASAAMLGVGLAAAFVVPVLCWWLPAARSGRTVGKRLLRLTVLSASTGQPPSAGRVQLRFLAGLVLSLPVVTFFVDVLWALWDPRGQTLHDKVARTYVVRR